MLVEATLLIDTVPVDEKVTVTDAVPLDGTVALTEVEPLDVRDLLIEGVLVLVAEIVALPEPVILVEWVDDSVQVPLVVMETVSL